MTEDNNITRPTDTALPPSGSGLGEERHVSDVAGRAPLMSKKAGVGVIIAGAAIACGVILLTSAQPNLTPEEGPKLAVNPQVTYVAPLPVPIVPEEVPAIETTLPELPTQAAGQIETVATPRRETKLLVYSGNMNLGTNNTGPGAGLMSPGLAGGLDSGPEDLGGLAGDQQQHRETLASRLTPTPLNGVSANVLRNKPYLLTMGTVIPCVLQTAMESTLPGLVTCVIPQDIQGKTGLTLLDRGTKVVGEFKGGLSQGVERMFVVWTRAETPQGVVVNLDSPATDPLGRSGMDGEVDRHFWQRFGGALLLSTVDGAMQAGIAAASKEGTTTINTGGVQSVISESLRSSINIPPTVRKHQGELVSIFVARDLDFSTVYGVQTTQPRYVRNTVQQERK